MINFKGKWIYYYRVADMDGKALDFMLSRQHDARTARYFFKQAIDTNAIPDEIVIDKSSTNLAGLHRNNIMSKLIKGRRLIYILQVKNLNNILKQDHRFIKMLTRSMMSFKMFTSASAIMKGIEVVHMIRMHQIGSERICDRTSCIACRNYFFL